MQSPLHKLFHPESIALIGATETAGTVGSALLANLRATFPGQLYAVNPNHKSVNGIRCYGSVADVPRPLDLAVIATPGPTVPGVIAECGAAGVPGAIIISAGFREAGAQGVALEKQILRVARRSKMRVIGPNCLGLMRPDAQLNATFASSMARPGNLAFISQSGALCTAILDWSHREKVGFSAFVSVGSMLDVGWGDLIQYLGDDPKTRSIIVYMESVDNARSFMSAAREVALSKPIIVIKPGRTAAGAKAAASHTGALTGADDVLDAAFRRCGVLRVNTIAELFYLAEALDKQPRPRGPNLSIITNAGGPAVLATDALLAEGGRLAELTPETVGALDAFLPSSWSHHNPVDILGDASADRYEKATDILTQDSATDGLLMILTPQAMTNPTEVAQRVARFAKLGKPVLASWMGGQDVAQGEMILNEANIPTYAYPDAAAAVFQSMWRYSTNLKALYETPAIAGIQAPDGAARVSASIDEIRSTGRTLLTEVESKQLLEAYEIPTVETEVALSADQAIETARRLGYPVVLKLHSQTVTHKTDVGGVKLNLANDEAVRAAFTEILEAVTQRVGREHFLGVTVQPMVRLDGYELILGCSADPQFGPVLLFGGGGQLVEVYKDSSVGLPPLNTTLARLMMERTKIFTALQGVRGRNPVDLEGLERLLVRFSTLVVEQPWIKEIDINPLLASPDRLLALDARIVLYGKETQSAPIPAIRPYPIKYAKPSTLRDGTTILIRPIRPDDEPAMIRFHGQLSERSVYQRYFEFLSLEGRIAHERLTRICFNDYDREIALIAEQQDGKISEILAVARLVKAHLVNEAEAAFLIADKYQGQGLGTELARRLLQVARDERLDRVTMEFLTGNDHMLALAQDLGFQMDFRADGVIHAHLTIVG